MKRILLFIASAILSATALAQLTQPPGGITGNMPPWSGGNGSSGQVLTSRGATLAPTFQAAGGGSTGANPTATVGTTAVNGVATTFLRSDGAPAINLAMVPTWTGNHTFSAAAVNAGFGSIDISTASSPSFSTHRTGSAADAKGWNMDAGGANTLLWRATNDANNNANNYFAITRSGFTIASIEYGNTTQSGAGTKHLFDGGIISAGTKFTAVGTGCTVGTTVGGATAGTFTLAAGPCTSVAVTLNGATGITATNGWTCQAHDRTAPTVLIGGESASTTTTATFTIPAGAGTADVISFSCIGF